MKMMKNDENDENDVRGFGGYAAHALLHSGSGQMHLFINYFFNFLVNFDRFWSILIKLLNYFIKN